MFISLFFFESQSFLKKKKKKYHGDNDVISLFECWSLAIFIFAFIKKTPPKLKLKKELYLCSVKLFVVLLNIYNGCTCFVFSKTRSSG